MSTRGGSPRRLRAVSSATIVKTWCSPLSSASRWARGPTTQAPRVSTSSQPARPACGGSRPIEETLSALDDLVRAGKVRYIGCSNFTGWQIEKSVRVSEREGLARFDCLQPQYSLVVRDIEHEVLPASREEGLGVIPWSPLAGGFLTGKYSREDAPPENTRMASWGDTWKRHATPEKFNIVDRVCEIANSRGKEPAQIALSWVKDRPGVTSPILGARNVEQLDKNLGVIGWSLEERELNLLEEVSTLSYAYPYNMIARVNA